MNTWTWGIEEGKASISLIALVLVLLTGLGVYIVRAQDQPPGPVAMPQSPLDQALSQKLLNEVWMGVQCQQNAIALQTALTQAQAQIDALKKQLAEGKK